MKRENKVRVLVVDDHFAVRMGLITSIQMENDLLVVGEATTGPEAIELYQKYKPDVVLMDLLLPGMSGVEATAAIIEAHPEARVLVFSSWEGDEDIYRSLQAGAFGYVLKSSTREELIRALRTVVVGKRYLPASIAVSMTERLPENQLSPREIGVVRLIAAGKANKEIADEFSLTEGTVKFHVGNILVKLQANDRAQAVVIAMKRGIIHPD